MLEKDHKSPNSPACFDVGGEMWLKCVPNAWNVQPGAKNAKAADPRQELWLMQLRVAARGRSQQCEPRGAVLVVAFFYFRAHGILFVCPPDPSINIWNEVLCVSRFVCSPDQKTTETLILPRARSIWASVSLGGASWHRIVQNPRHRYVHSNFKPFLNLCGADAADVFPPSERDAFVLSKASDTNRDGSRLHNLFLLAPRLPHAEVFWPHTCTVLTTTRGRGQSKIRHVQRQRHISLFEAKKIFFTSSTEFELTMLLFWDFRT